MKCPGQDMQYWDENAIYEVKCPQCEAMVEFYKDDTTRKCHNCQHRFVNPKMDFGCATYCQFAEQCLGTLPEDFVLSQDNLLKDKVAVAMKRHFHTDFKRIRMASQLGFHAERLGKTEENVNLALILCSAYLLLIGYHSAASKHENVTKQRLEEEGPRIAAKILSEIGANENLVDQVCKIIGNKSLETREEELARAIVNDAYRLTLLEQQLKEGNIGRDDVERGIEEMASGSAREEARRLLADH